ncbi:MAG: PEP-CTERM sorting domain-containing protein [Gammaproteobacteria bacterium]|nr:PEP-CTERM sorting domain-containing protein [Gammaproteobacteria bacterium]
MLISGVVSAAPITLLSDQSFWNFNVTATNFGGGGLGSVDYAGFLSEYTGNEYGQAGFGNSTPPSGGATNTGWVAHTDLALQQVFNLSGSVIGDVTLNLAVDNGSKVFVNGTEVFYSDRGGYTSIWEYTQTVSGSLFNSGINTVSVLANDYGGLTYFDMKLVANDGVSSNVPEPSILVLFGAGLAGLGFARRRKLRA